MPLSCFQEVAFVQKYPSFFEYPPMSAVTVKSNEIKPNEETSLLTK